MEDFQPYIEAQTWVYAKTMPRCPHEYVLLARSTDPETHQRFVAHIKAHGTPRPFHGRTMFTYLVVGDHEYWAGIGSRDDWTIINRRHVSWPIDAPAGWQRPTS